MEQAHSIHPTITSVAEERGIKPRILEYHVRELHGWQPEDQGFADEVNEIAACKREECLVLIDELVQAAVSKPREHIVSDTERCWCDPETVHVPAAFTPVPF